MKRYIIFAFDQYYPCGGLSDIIAHVAEKEDAIQRAKDLKRWHFVDVYDCELEDVVWSKE
jgi:hypothetical protein